MSVVALLLCAGRGERLGLGLPKAAAPLAGRPLFAHPLEALERCDAIDSVIVVGPVKVLRDALGASGFAPRKVASWIEGGRERQHSVARGLAALSPEAEWVAIHDAARALVSPALIASVVIEARSGGAAIATIPLDDTLKRGALGAVEATVPRASLWRAQTPQVFRRDWLESAHAAAGTAIATDDAALVEALGHRVKLVSGEVTNFKITTADDLALAESVLVRRTAERT